MTRIEIENRIDKLETDRFFLKMIDRWSEKDYTRDRQLEDEIRELKEMLEKA